MKLLITGGCGFLGSNLASHAIDKGIDVCVVDNLFREGSPRNLEWLRTLGHFDYVSADVRDADAIANVVERFRPDAVYHLAGQVATTTSIADPRLDFEINALGTLNVLEAVRRHAEQATVIYSSTNKVYGDLKQYRYDETAKRYVCLDFPRGFDESVPLEFHSPYGCSKGAADQYLLDYHRIFGLRTVVFRHSSMYGGRQFATADQGWIGWFCQKAVEAARGDRAGFTISGSGKQVRDVLHADDMIRLYFGATAGIDAIAGRAFNVGGGIDNSLSLLELFDVLEDFTGTPLDFRRLPQRISDQRFFVADIEGIGRAIDWKPEVDARQGVGRMVEWVSTF